MNNREIDALIRQHKNMIIKLEQMKQKIVIERSNNTKPAELIIQKVNELFKVDCRKDSRLREVVDARYAAIFFMRRHTNLSLKNIAKLLNRSDHTTIIAGLKRYHALREVDGDYVEKTDQLSILFC